MRAGPVGNGQAIAGWGRVEAMGGGELAVLGRAVGLAAENPGPPAPGNACRRDVVCAVAIGHKQRIPDERRIGRVKGISGELYCSNSGLGSTKSSFPSRSRTATMAALLAGRNSRHLPSKTPIFVL